MLETKTTRKSKVKSVWGVAARGAGSGVYEPGCSWAVTCSGLTPRIASKPVVISFARSTEKPRTG